MTPSTCMDSKSSNVSAHLELLSQAPNVALYRLGQKKKEKRFVDRRSIDRSIDQSIDRTKK